MATIGSMLWVTREELRLAGISLERDLAVTPDRGPMDDDDPEPIEQWVERRRIGIPLHFGLEAWGNRAVEEDCADGFAIEVRKLPDPNHEKAAPGQEQFFVETFNAVEDHYAVLAEAPTGSGKTVTVLNTIGKLGRSAVVVVPSTNLMYQWAEEAKTHLGLIDDEIGFVGDGKEDWRGKPLVIVVLHNLFLKAYPNDFYRAFGFAAFDEIHNLGAREFSKSMHCFPAKYKIGVSATPDRKDGCAEIFLNYFGPVKVRSEQEALPITCHVLPFYHAYVPQWISACRSSTKPLLWLSKHEKRNAKITKLGVTLYDEGYHVLILSKYIDHVELIIASLIEAGVPEDDIAQFTGQRTVVVDGEEKRRKIKATELKTIRENPPPVIVGTYSMLKEGVDIPRIDAGVEALPVADARQAIGRARRPHPDKGRPQWYSLKDVGFSGHSGLAFLYGYTSARLRGFREVGVTINEGDEQ